MKNIFRLLIIIPLFTSLFSQGRTIGTRLLNPLNHPPVPGYKLIYMHGQPNVYLIDEWGAAVHVWRDTLLFPGNAAFLTEEGKLYKTSSRGRNANPSFQAGGSGDFLQLRDWGWLGGGPWRLGPESAGCLFLRSSPGPRGPGLRRLRAPS